MLERVSIECRKTKTKVITWANQKGRRRSSKPIKTRSNYTQQNFDETILARPRVAVITSEPAADIPPAEHSTIPLVLTYHPTNQPIKNIISPNFHLLRDDPDTTAIFQPLLILYAYRRDQNLWDYLLSSTLTSPTTADEDRGAFPCGRSRCNTCLHANPSTFIDSPGGRITFTSKYTCVSENVVYAIKCHAIHKINMRETARRLDAWVTDLGNIYAPHGYQTPIFLLDAISLLRGTLLRTCWSL